MARRHRTVVKTLRKRLGRRRSCKGGKGKRGRRTYRKNRGGAPHNYVVQVEPGTDNCNITHNNTLPFSYESMSAAQEVTDRLSELTFLQFKDKQQTEPHDFVKPVDQYVESVTYDKTNKEFKITIIDKQQQQQREYYCEEFSFDTNIMLFN